MTETDDRLAGSRTRRTAKAPSRGKGLKIKRVFTTAGATALTRTPWWASSFAAALVMPTMPAFDRWLQLQRESLASDAAAAGL